MENFQDQCPYCRDCKPNWIFIGEFNEKYFLVHDKITNKYLIGDSAEHADSIYEFSQTPTVDPIAVNEEPHEDDPIWNDSDAWIEKWVDDRDKFMFAPNIAYDLIVAFKESGWSQKKNGDLFFHIVNCAGLLIDLHEYQKLEDTPIGNENAVEWSKEKFNRIQDFIKNQSNGQRPA